MVVIVVVIVVVRVLHISTFTSTFRVLVLGRLVDLGGSQALKSPKRYFPKIVPSLLAPFSCSYKPASTE